MALELEYHDLTHDRSNLLQTRKDWFVLARRRLAMEAMSSFFLPRLIGYAKALHVASTGSTYAPDHKLLEGLFSEVLDKLEQVLPRAIEIAEDMAANCGSVSLMLMKEMIWRNP